MIKISHILTFLLISGVCHAQTSIPNSEAQALSQIQTIQKAANIDINKLIAEGKEAVFAEELLLNTLLSTPENKRQYVFPAVQEALFFGKKIKTHPEIIVWKGKKPTDIAPQLKEYAAKYLNDLNPTYYTLLDPDLWKQNDQPNNSYTLTWDASDWDKLALTRANYFYTMPDAGAFYKMTPEAEASFKTVTISEKDIQQLSTTMRALPDFYDSVANPKEMEMKMRHVLKSEQDFIRNVADPFQELVVRIDAAGEKQAFADFLKKQGWATPELFAQQADTILKAYRIKDLTPIKAMLFSKIRKLYPIQKGEPMTPMQMYAYLYDVSAGNALFVIKYQKELTSLFENQEFGTARVPIYLD